MSGSVRSSIKRVMFVMEMEHANATQSVYFRFNYLSKARCLVRSHDERLSKVLKRLRATMINASSSGKKKHRNDFQISAPTFQVFVDENPDSTVEALQVSELIELLKQGRAIELIDTTTATSADLLSYTLCLNVPSIQSISFTGPLVSTMPLVPKIETLYCSPADCTFKWFYTEDDNEEKIDQSPVVLSTDLIYTPTQADVGRTIHFSCTPPLPASISSELVQSAITQASVLTVATERPVEQKSIAGDNQPLHKTRTKNDAGTRFVSYNILYDNYVKKTLEQNPTLFDHISREHLLEPLRLGKTLHQLLDTDADVIMCQEVGQDGFDHYLNPVLSTKGYSSVFAVKAGTVPEGCSISLRNSKYEILETERMPIRIQYDTLLNLQTLVQELHPGLHDALLSIPTIAQFVVAKDINTKTVKVFTNLHLYYKEGASVVRLLQLAIALNRAAEIKEKWSTASEIIIGGDLNSRPDTLPIMFLKNGAVEFSDNEVNSLLRKFVFRNKTCPGSNESVRERLGALLQSPVLSHDFKFIVGSGNPEFTTYVPGFVATLDYIFVQESKSVITALETPSIDSLLKFTTALPSQDFPSDHILIGCDIIYLYF